MEPYEKALKEVEHIINNKRDLISCYINASNSLTIEADGDNNEYQYNYYLELTKLLRDLIVSNEVKKAGYYIAKSSGFSLYKKLQ